MFGNQFYHTTTKRLVAVFGTIFNDIGETVTMVRKEKYDGIIGEAVFTKLLQNFTRLLVHHHGVG